MVRSFDLRDPAFLGDPAPMLAAMRGQGEIVRVRLPLMGWTWLTTTDAAARELLKDQRRFSRNPARAGKGDIARYFWWMPPFMKPLMRNIILAEGEDHRRLRGLVDGAFARTSVEDLRPEIARLADDLLDWIDPARPVDIVAAYTRKLPLLVICALLGVPDADRRRIMRWIGPISRPTGLTTIVFALPGLWRIMRHFRADFAAVRRNGRPGLIRELVAAEDAGERLSEDELLAMVFTLFVAGHETTVHLITGAILALIDRPEGRTVFRDGAGDVGIAVEEFMRFLSPVMMSKGLFALHDTTFRGVEMKRGDMFSALLIAANHDPARFDAPGELRLSRRPNAHLGFGHGPHVCLGMQIARAEAQIALTRLFTRYPGLRLADPARRPRPARRLGLRGHTRLDLVLSR